MTSAFKGERHLDEFLQALRSAVTRASEEVTLSQLGNELRLTPEFLETDAIAKIVWSVSRSVWKMFEGETHLDIKLPLTLKFAPKGNQHVLYLEAELRSTGIDILSQGLCESVQQFGSFVHNSAMKSWCPRIEIAEGADLERKLAGLVFPSEYKKSVPITFPVPERPPRLYVRDKVGDADVWGQVVFG